MHSSKKIAIENLSFAAPPIVRDYFRRCLLVGIVFAIASIIGFVIEPEQAIHSYLVGFLVVVGLSTGPLGFLCLAMLTGGKWALPMRRIWEAATRNIPFAALAFIPVVIGYKKLFPWANPEVMQHSEHLKRLGEQYLNLHGFVFRGILYFIAWFALAFTLNRMSALQDRPPDRFLGRRLGAIGGGGIVAYAWMLSFAAIDWIMSLTPGWPSTIFPLIILVGQGLLALSLGIIVARLLIDHEPVSVLADAEVFHDNGKLLFAFIMLWAYLSFSQWLIDWAGNLPEEIHWFLVRIHNGWGGLALFLVLFHFAVPFSILLSQGLKKDPRKLVWVAVWMILMRYWDLFWMTAPTWHHDRFHYSWLDIVVPIALVSLWFALFFRQLMSRPLVALHDPRLRAILGAEHE